MQVLELLEPIGLATHGSNLAEPKFVRDANLVSREVAGEMVVVPICRGVGDLDSIFTFNAVGTHVWNLLTESRTEVELTRAVTSRFQVTEPVAQSDVRNFLTDLVGVGLVRTV